MRQRKKVSGIGDVLLHFAIFPAHLSRNWFRRAMFNALSRWFPLPQSAAQVHHSPLPRNEQRYEMGRHAQSAWIIRVFAALLLAPAPALVHAAATAQGVALSASAGCGNGNLDITLTTVGANREAWRATDLVDSTLSQGEGPATGLSSFSGTFTDFKLVFSPSPPANSRSRPTPTSARRRPTRPIRRSSSSSTNARTARSCCRASALTELARRPRSRRSSRSRPRCRRKGRSPSLVTIVLVAGLGGRALSRRT